jgi:hypothetical protein
MTVTGRWKRRTRGGISGNRINKFNVCGAIMTYGIVITAIGQTKKVEIALRTIRPYARKVGAEVVVIDQPRLAINGPGGYNYLNFEKFQVADCFDIFDRILRLDSDVLINPEAPNIFEETEDASFAAVMEDHGSRAAQRRKEVQRLAHRFSVPACTRITLTAVWWWRIGKFGKRLSPDWI